MESKRKKVENPICDNPDHFKERLKSRKRQRHTCYKCMSTDLTALNSNPNLTRWDVTRIMVSLTRAYVCSVCLLSHEGNTITAKTAPKVSHCKKHSVFNEQRLCTLHKKRWTRCRLCLYDLRAATSFCRVCSQTFQKQCLCAREPENLTNITSAIRGQQPQGQIALKQKLTADLLECARQLEETKEIGNKDIAIDQIRSAFCADTSSLRTIFQLHADHRLLDPRCTEHDAAVSALMALRNG